MSNTGKFIVLLVGGLLVAAVALVAIAIGLGGADPGPSLRAADLAAATEADVPEAYAGAINPFDPGDADAIAAGELLATRRCRSCHGMTLRGSRGGVPDLVASAQARSDGFLFWAISEGSRQGMPNWGNALSEEERWQVVTYLRSLGTD